MTHNYTRVGKRPKRSMKHLAIKDWKIPYPVKGAKPKQMAKHRIRKG